MWKLHSASLCSVSWCSVLAAVYLLAQHAWIMRIALLPLNYRLASVMSQLLMTCCKDASSSHAALCSFVLLIALAGDHGTFLLKFAPLFTAQVCITAFKHDGCQLARQIVVQLMQYATITLPLVQVSSIMSSTVHVIPATAYPCRLAATSSALF